MRVSIHNKLSIWYQAILIFALTTVWVVSGIRFSSVEEPAVYWVAIYCWVPFVLLACTGVLLLSYFRSNGEQGGMVRAALLTALGPWLAWLLFRLLHVLSA